MIPQGLSFSTFVVVGKFYDDSIPSPDCKDIRPVEKDTMDCQNKGDDSVSQEKEDTLWTVFHRLKAVFEPPLDRVPSSSLRSVSLMGVVEGISPVKQSKPGNGTRSGRNGARGAISARVHHDIIYDGFIFPNFGCQCLFLVYCLGSL